MPQVGSYSTGHSPPCLTYVPTNEVATAPTLDLAFSMPSPPPHAPNVEKDIMRCESKDDKILEVITVTPESLQFEHRPSQPTTCPVVGGSLLGVSLVLEGTIKRSIPNNTKDTE